MKKIKAKGPLLFLVLGMVGLFLCVSARAKKGPEPRAQVEGGMIAGTMEDGLRVFKGIPFAAPPTGANRWRAPQPVVPWTGVRQTTEYGPAPMQDRGIAVMMSLNPNVKVSEDCLYLNVWSPAKRVDEKLPVMVWIYGGGYINGQTGSPLYDGMSLAKHGVIVVSIAYRYGAFGFLAHPELSRESGHGSGTYGLQDQIAGLRWVKNNIAQFGGNPNRVTVFGESAGGGSAFLLAASPQARGLFQRVICESGPTFDLASAAQPGNDAAGSHSLAAAEKAGAAFLEKLNASDLKTARALSSDAILKASGQGLVSSFAPPQDGYVLVGNSYPLYRSGKFNDTPILLGTNSDDGEMFTPPGITLAKYREFIQQKFGDKADTVLAVYPATTDAEAAQQTRLLLRDTALAWGTWTWARLHAGQGKGDAYLYYFDRHDAKSPNGAGHASELPYIFGFFHPWFGLKTTEDRVFSETMQQYWTNFAKTGDPNGPGLTRWPAFRATEGQVMDFAVDTKATPVPNLPQLQKLDELVGREPAKKLTP